MSTKPRARARIALPDRKGNFVEKEIPNDDEQDGELLTCPETGKSLEGVDCRKLAISLWPSLDINNLPNTEAGARFQLLLDEHHRRADVA